MSSSEALSPAAQDPVPPGACPLCGAGNACAMAGGGDPNQPCWCVTVSFSDELLACVPPAARAGVHLRGLRSGSDTAPGELIQVWDLLRGDLRHLWHHRTVAAFGVEHYWKEGSLWTSRC